MDLMDLVREYFRPGSTAMYTEPGQSYGPAVSRHTRTPISFSNRYGPQENGRYITDPDLAPGIKSQPRIVINPQSNEIKRYHNIKDVINHEDTHALLDQTMRKYIGPKGDTEEALSILKGENPFHEQLSNELSLAGRAGYMPAETPAYAVEKKSGVYGVDPFTRSGYLQQMISTLQGIDPKAASTYKYLSGTK